MRKTIKGALAVSLSLDTGHAVLEGRRDWLAVRDPDRWLGGVHLEGGKPIWRWDPEKGRLTPEGE